MLSLFRVASVLTIGALLAVGGAATPAPANAASSRIPLEEQVDQLRKEAADEKAIRKEQQDDAQYFFQAVTIVIGVVAIVIAVGAIATTVVGYQFVRRYVETEFSKRAAEAYDQHGKPVLERRASEMQREVDAKLAEVDQKLSDELELFRSAGGHRP